jgi:CRP/FNR family transcriptional regulator, cyclic AMP receptor protein
MTDVNANLWKKSVIGRDLSDAEANELFLASTRESYDADTFLFKEGDSAEAFYLIVNGEIDIEKKRANNQTSRITRLDAGAIVGEMSLLTDENRSASARATEDGTTVLRVQWSVLERLLTENSNTAYKIMRALARLLAYRLKQINLKVVELSHEAEGDGRKLEEFAKFKQKLFKDWSF